MATSLNLNEPLVNTKSMLNEKNINHIIRLFYLRWQVLIGVLVNIVLLIVLLMSRQYIKNILITALIANALLVIIFSIVDLFAKNKIQKLNQSKIVSFYENYILILNKENDSKIICLYKDIIKAFVTKNYIYLKIDKSYLAISNEDIILIKPKIIRLLVSNNKRVMFTLNKKQSLKTSAYKTTRTFSLILFVASIISVVIGFLIYLIKVENDVYDFAPGAEIRFTWVFFIPIAIPLASLLFGIIYNHRQSTVKNIVVGAIATVILFSFGSINFIFGKTYNHNELIIQCMTEEFKLIFPENYLIINEYYNDIQNSYIKITSDKEAFQFEEYIKYSNSWERVERMPNDLTKVFKDFKEYYDYYYYSEKLSHNKYLGYDYIIIFYNTDNDLAEVICIDA